VVKSHRWARYWFKKAASAGHPLAREKVASSSNKMQNKKLQPSPRSAVLTCVKSPTRAG
jgi:hypothetical protein